MSPSTSLSLLTSINTSATQLISSSTVSSSTTTCSSSVSSVNRLPANDAYMRHPRECR